MKTVPFFIIGSPRSGTTLLRLMINANPEATVTPECGFALHLADDFSHRLNYDGKLYKDFAKAVTHSRKFETWGLSERDILRPIEEREPKTYTDLCSCIYLAYAKKQNKTPLALGDKNNYYIEHLDRLTSIFPESKLVFIVRDGRDVACSYREAMRNKTTSKYKPNLPTQIMDIATSWSSACQSIMYHSKKNTRIVRFEDLISLPLISINGIFDFLDISPTNNPLAYLNELDEPEEFMAWKNRVARAPDLSRIGRYTRELTSEEIAIFEQESRAELELFNYM